MASGTPAVAAEPGAPDFPQTIGGAPWSDFSVEPPAHASDRIAGASAVTGSQYEQGHITGPFGKADGKVTGTEQARFGRGPGRADDVPPAVEQGALQQPVGHRVQHCGAHRSRRVEIQLSGNPAHESAF